MKIEIKDHCIRCGICVGLYPELFAHNFIKDRIDVEQEPESGDQIESARKAAADCAVTAIFLQE